MAIILAGIRAMRGNCEPVRRDGGIRKTARAVRDAPSLSHSPVLGDMRQPRTIRKARLQWLSQLPYCRGSRRTIDPSLFIKRGTTRRVRPNIATAAEACGKPRVGSLSDCRGDRCTHVASISRLLQAACVTQSVKLPHTHIRRSDAVRLPRGRI